MSTLTQPALSMLIDRLFAEADAAENARGPATRPGDRGDYLQYYGLLKDQPLPVSRATGRLLYMLARSVRARTIVEFGTSFGISTLHLAAALFCGWLQGYFGWSPQEISLEPPAPEHGHAHAHH